MSDEAVWLAGYAVNALWQAPLLALGAWSIDRLLRWAAPAVRHRMCVAALLLECVLPACSSAPLHGLVVKAHLLLGWLLHPGASAGYVQVGVTLRPLISAPAGRAWAAIVLPCFAALAALFLVLRLGYRVERLRLLSRRARLLPSDPRVLACWQQCRAAFRMRDVVLLHSSTVSGPIAFGWPQAQLLLPAGMAAALDEPELLAVLAHEAAHIERGDYLKNLGYEVASLLVGWHPALWFTRARLAETREMVCDARAAELFDSPRSFGRSLLRLALQLLRQGPATIPNAIGMFDANTLERRIEMLTAKQGTVSGMRRVMATAMGAVVGVATMGAVVSLHVEAQAGAPASSTRPVSQADPIRISSGVAAGQVVSRVPPQYPTEAKQAKVQGAVVLHAIIDEQGVVQQLSVVSGPEELRQSALTAVKQWVYRPYVLNGNPVAVETTITVNYSLGFVKRPS